MKRLGKVRGKYAPAPPYAVGEYVTATYRISPFRMEEVLGVVECRLVGTTWRVLCEAMNRADARGWLDADILVSYPPSDRGLS